MSAKPTSALSRSDLADLNAFRRVERLRSFTKAAVELGITTSALSHAIRNLETRLGVRLLNRTSRAVTPTDAGASLARRLNRGFQEIGDALDEIACLRDRPVGRLRLHALSDATRLILARYLPEFLRKYPEVEVEVSVDDRMTESLAEEVDASIRFGGGASKELIAVKLGTELKWVAVASPRYLYHRPPIQVPEDLLAHSCIRMRSGQGGEWAFRQGDDYRLIDVPGQICVSETTLALELAVAGTGIAYCLEDRVREPLMNGTLRVVLFDWSPLTPPLMLYYPGNRPIPSGLHELIALLREGTATEKMREPAWRLPASGAFA